MAGVMGQVNPQAINVNDPGLITLVNKLQDVFTTVGVFNLLRKLPVCAETCVLMELVYRFKIPSIYPKLP
jgi:hypothetical protein